MEERRIFSTGIRLVQWVHQEGSACTLHAYTRERLLWLEGWLYSSTSASYATRKEKDHFSLSQPDAMLRYALYISKSAHTISHYFPSLDDHNQNESLSLPLHIPCSPFNIIAIPTVGNKPPQAPQVATSEPSSADHNVDHHP